MEPPPLEEPSEPEESPELEGSPGLDFSPGLDDDVAETAPSLLGVTGVIDPHAARAEPATETKAMKRRAGMGASPQGESAKT
jgi:hypothetical protein